MHLADGIIQNTALLGGVSLLGAGALGVAVVRARRCARGAAWTGALAAFVLAAQAINLPALGGASAHAIGAGLLTACVGPARALLALFAVLAVQALLLADGGVTVLLLNLVNLAVIPIACVQTARHWLEGPMGLRSSVALGTFLGGVLGSLSLATLLVWGAGAPPTTTFGWLVGIQSLAGLVEGALTAIAIHYLDRRAPGLLRPTAPSAPRALDERVAPSEHDSAGQPGSMGGYALPLVLLAAGALVLLLPLASELPDALEVVMERLQTGAAP